MTELTGHRLLTPYRGGWGGNEMFPDVLTDDLRAKAAELVGRLGDRLRQEGYRGFFEVDFWSIDTAGDRPSMKSTSGLSTRPRNIRA